MRTRAATPDLLPSLLVRYVGTKIMDIGGGRRARNAREGMIDMSDELMALADEVGATTPNLSELHRHAVRPGPAV